MYIKINQLQGASYVPISAVKFFGEDFILDNTTLIVTDRGDRYRVPSDTVEIVTDNSDDENITPNNGNSYFLPDVGFIGLKSLNAKTFWVRRKDIAYVGDTTGKVLVGLTDGRTYKVVTPINEILEF